jgi:hypothetical protein
MIGHEKRLAIVRPYQGLPDLDRRLRASCPACEWPNCNAAATHRAPKGRTHVNEYWRFCLGHVP